MQRVLCFFTLKAEKSMEKFCGYEKCVYLCIRIRKQCDTFFDRLWENVAAMTDKPRVDGNIVFHYAEARKVIAGILKECGNSSVGRARPCQGRGREFESRLPLRENL